MKSLITAIFILMFFSLTNAPVRASIFEENFPDNLYDAAHPRHDRDFIFQFIVDGVATDIDVHSSVFKNINGFDSLFAEEKLLRIPFSSRAEASAFKKVMYFLYKDVKPDSCSTDPRFENFFDPDDFSELIFCAWKYQIDSLNLVLALFVHEEVKGKIESPNESILLDRLPKGKFESLYDAFNGAAENMYKKDHAMQSLRTSLDYYAHVLYFYKDPRIKADQIRFNPNIFNQMNDNHSLIKKRAFELKAQEKATEIYHKFCDELARKRNGTGSQTYWVNNKSVDQVSVILQERLPDFEIDLGPDFSDLKPNRHLTEFCDKPCTIGSCLAQSVGWVGWALLCVPQILTCDFCIPRAVPKEDRKRKKDCFWPNSYASAYVEKAPDCEEECVCGCQSGAAIAYAAYNAGTCCRRSIRIQPKKVDKSGLRLPPAPYFEASRMKDDF